MNAFRLQAPLLLGVAICAWACLVAPPLHAASIQLTIEYSQSYDSSFHDIGTPLLDSPPNANTSAGDYHQFHVFMELSDLLPQEDFLGLQFDIDMGPGVTSGGFWVPNNPSWDVPGPAPPEPIFFTNSDAGADHSDLQRIVVLASGSSGVADVMPGESGPFLLGDAYVQWDATSIPSYVGVRPNGLDPWGTYVGGAPTTQTAETFSVGSPFLLLGVPEPASLTLAGLAALGLLGLVRRR